MSDLDVRSRMANAAAAANDMPVDSTADLARGLRARSRRRHRRLAAAAATGTAVVALGTGGLAKLGPATPDRIDTNPSPDTPTTSTTDLAPAAYSVKEADGTVTVSHHWTIDPEQGEQLERDIEAYGVAAEVDVGMDGEMCGNRRGGNALAHTLIKEVEGGEGHADGRATFSFRPADFRPSQTIVLEFAQLGARNGAAWVGLMMRVLSGPVPPCQLESTLTMPD